MGVNGGEIPVLELPNGKMIADTNLMVELAIKIGGKRGFSLRPYEFADKIPRMVS